MKRDVKIAMAGLAHVHGTGFLKKALTFEGVSVVGFYDNDNPENARAASEEFGAPVYTDRDALLSSGANMLLTARINCDKPEYIIRALEAGLGVVADKPMATRMEDVDAIEAAAKKSGAPLYLMLTERFGEAICTAKKLIDEGAIGTVAQQYLVRPHRLHPTKRPAWMYDHARYGGIISAIGVHDVDLARFFSGQEVKSILASHTANARHPQFTDFWDTGMTMMEMADGSVATVAVNWLTPDEYHAHGDTRFYITGTRGYIEVSTVNKTVRFYSDTEKEQYVPVSPLPMTVEEDALNAMSDWSYRPAVTTHDSIEATRATLLAQIAADNYRKSR